MKTSNSPKRHRTLFILYAAFLIFWIGVAIYLRISGNLHQPKIRDTQLESISAWEDKETINVGVFCENFYGFEPASETFKADGWIWLAWSPRLQGVITEQGISPDQIIHFTNLVDDWDSRLESGIEKAVRLPDGRHYQKFRFSGYFNANGVDYHKYPFQRVSLPISIELSDIVSLVDKNRVFLAPDRDNSGVGDYIGISGYIFEGFDIISGLHLYQNSFGITQNIDLSKKSQVRFSASYRKSPTTAFLKLLLPLITVMALTLFSPSLSVTGWDVRVSIPPTALLSLIFLQQGHQDQLPELSYLTYLDTIYNLCYLVNLILFGLFLWGSNEYHSATEAEREHITANIEVIDRRFQICLTVFVVFALLINWFSISRNFS